MERRVVVPGEVVTTERKKIGRHVFVEGGKIYADCLGLADVNGEYANVIPLQGKYMPRAGDLIVGIIVSEEYSGYVVDINSFYFSFLSKEKLRKPLKKGDIVSAKISYVDEINQAELENVRVFYGGEIVTISPVKIPRVIGKNGSMLNVLKQGTGSALMAGRNGRVWIKGGNIPLLKKALRKIEEEAHTSNLTNNIEQFLKEENAKRENSTQNVNSGGI